MTQITLTNRTRSHVFSHTELNVNGKHIAVNGRISRLIKTQPGFWNGIANGYEFIIFGGKQSGGAANEWFVRWDALGPDLIRCKSAVECVTLIETA